jgi:hypothetical protein
MNCFPIFIEKNHNLIPLFFIYGITEKHNSQDAWRILAAGSE